MENQTGWFKQGNGSYKLVDSDDAYNEMIQQAMQRKVIEFTINSPEVMDKATLG